VRDDYEIGFNKTFMGGGGRRGRWASFCLLSRAVGMGIQLARLQEAGPRAHASLL